MFRRVSSVTVKSNPLAEGPEVLWPRVREIEAKVENSEVEAEVRTEKFRQRVGGSELSSSQVICRDDVSGVCQNVIW